MRIICLDIGTRRIGVAASDPFGWTAQPVKVVERRMGFKELEEIAGLCSELKARVIVVGVPLDEEGRIGPAAEKIKAFAARIEKHLRSKGIDTPIEFWDERYSTAIAEDRLIGADASRAKRKKLIDKMAAVVILEDYLDAHGRAAKGCEDTEG